MRASVHFSYDSKNISRLVCGAVKVKLQLKWDHLITFLVKKTKG